MKKERLYTSIFLAFCLISSVLLLAPKEKSKLTGSASSEPVSWSINEDYQTEFNANSHTPVTMEFTVDNPENNSLDYKWYKASHQGEDSGCYFDYDYDQPIKTDAKNSYQITVPDDCEEDSDGGLEEYWYMCIVVDETGHEEYAYFKINMTNDDWFVYEPEDMYEIKKGDSLEVKLDVENEPAEGLNFTWYYSGDDSQLAVTKESTLSLTPEMLEDSRALLDQESCDDFTINGYYYANYYCIVTDENEKEERIDFEVSVDTLSWSANENEADYTIHPGEKVTLDAGVTNPDGLDLKYAWTESNGDEEEITEPPEGSILGTSNTLSVQPEKDTYYTCIITDNDGHKKFIPFSVSINRQTQAQWMILTDQITISDKKEVSLDAYDYLSVSKDSATKLSFEWSDPDGNLISSKSKVKGIKKPGNYICNISDSYDNSDDLNVNVEIGKDWNVTETIVELEGTEGKKMTIDATSYVKNPKNRHLTYTWYADSESKTSSYRITAHDQDEYTCGIQDDNGNEEYIIFDIRTSSWVCKNSEDQHVIVSSEGTATLKAEVENPENTQLQYQWFLYQYQEDGAFPVLYSKNQSSLTLENVKEDAAYECEIIDRANNKSQSIRFSLDTKEDTGTNWTIKDMTYDPITGEYTKEVSANANDELNLSVNAANSKYTNLEYNWANEVSSEDGTYTGYHYLFGANGPSITVPKSSRLTGDIICIIEAHPDNGEADDDYDEITCRFVRK